MLATRQRSKPSRWFKGTKNSIREFIELLRNSVIAGSSPIARRSFMSDQMMFPHRLRHRPDRHRCTHLLQSLSNALLTISYTVTLCCGLARRSCAAPLFDKSMSSCNELVWCLCLCGSFVRIVSCKFLQLYSAIWIGMNRTWYGLALYFGLCSYLNAEYIVGSRVISEGPPSAHSCQK